MAKLLGDFHDVHAFEDQQAREAASQISGASVMAESGLSRRWFPDTTLPVAPVVSRPGFAPQLGKDESDPFHRLAPLG
jgi:hypothetical protein